MMSACLEIESYADDECNFLRDLGSSGQVFLLHVDVFSFFGTIAAIKIDVGAFSWMNFLLLILSFWCLFDSFSIS